MDPLEQAHRVLQNVLIVGQITLNGQPMSLMDLQKVASAEQLLFDVATGKKTQAKVEPPQAGEKLEIKK